MFRFQATQHSCYSVFTNSTEVCKEHMEKRCITPCKFDSKCTYITLYINIAQKGIIYSIKVILYIGYIGTFYITQLNQTVETPF